MAKSGISSVAFRRRAGLALVLVILGIAAAWYFWPHHVPLVEPALSLVLVVSGDTQGWLTPCGCTVNQSGGLPRRGTYIDELRRRHTVLYADVGGAIGGSTPYHAVKLAAILRGEVEMQVAAHNLGAAEIAFGPRAIELMAAATKTPFLGTNAATAAGAPLAPALRIIEAAGVRVAFAGVLSPKYQTAAIHIAPPRAAILQALAAHKGSYDRLIVLAYMGEDELESLARELPEADAVIGGPTGQSMAPHRNGPTLIASATNKGKFVAEIPLDSRDITPPHIIELNAGFKDAPRQMENVASYLQELATRDFSAHDTGLAAIGKSGVVAGSESCQSCHQSDFALWSRSNHAHAWQSLSAKNMHVDPSCQLCHTTGYGAAGGFNSIASTPARINVGCEDCHGPSDAHVKNPKVKTPFLAAAQCLACHDEESSPTFNYATFWAKIQHGPKRAAATSATREAAQ